MVCDGYRIDGEGRARRLLRPAAALDRRVRDAATRYAAKAGGAGRLVYLSALLHARTTDLFGAARGQIRLADADFALRARIQTSGDLRTRFAHRRVGDRVCIAATRA